MNCYFITDDDKLIGPFKLKTMTVVTRKSIQNESKPNKMKQKILNTISDLCGSFLYYDRKEDETLSMDELNNAVENGTITVDEMVAEFRKHLENTFK